MGGDGTQLASLDYPHLARTEILESLDLFYMRFYFRVDKRAGLSAKLVRRPPTPGRRLPDGGEFVHFLGRRPRSTVSP